MQTASWRDRAASATGAAFVACILVGNSLTASGTNGATDPTPQQALDDAAVLAEGMANRLGFALELVGFMLLAVFVARVVTVLRRTGGLATAGVVVAIAATAMLGLKLATGGASLAAAAGHEHLSPTEALALTEIGSVGFVLSWVPFGLFVASAALALGAAGLVGRVLQGTGLAVGSLSLVLGALSVTDPANAMPVPFLLSLVWTLAVSVRLATARTAAAPALDTRVAVPA